MKPISIILCAALVPAVAHAQTHVSKAFTDFIANPAVQSTENHYFDKDPVTKHKSEQYDIYKFTMSADDIRLINEIEKAFEQDSDEAYSISYGIQSGYMAPLSLAVGNGNDGVYLAQNVGDNYMMACFLDPDDPNHIYRYAYAIDWNDNSGQVTGTLAVTYSTTLTYRQQLAEQQLMGVGAFVPQTDVGQDTLLDLVRNFNNALLNDNQPTWFSQFMFLVGCMSEEDVATRQAFAGKLYELVSLADDYHISSQDKAIAADVVNNLIIHDKDKDPVVRSLLTGCCKLLK